MFNSRFDPEKIGFQKGYYVETRPMRLDDTRGFIHLMSITGVIPKYCNEWEIESLHMEA